jgi:hypothetical protein
MGHLARRIAEALLEHYDVVTADPGWDEATVDSIAAVVEEAMGCQWIPVSERLPPLDETILYACYLGPTEGFTDVESGRGEGARNDIGQPAMRPVWGDDDHWGPCSYWMPLPEPPKEGK